VFITVIYLILILDWMFVFFLSQLNIRWALTLYCIGSEINTDLKEILRDCIRKMRSKAC